MAVPKLLALSMVSMAMIGCDRREQTTPPASAVTATLQGSNDGVLLTTEEVSGAVQVIFKDERVPVFRVTADQVELLDDCEIPGAFKYETLSVSRSSKTRETVSGATLTVTAGASEVASAGFDRRQSYQIDVTKAGYHQLLADPPSVVDLLDCPQATHVAQIIYVGAFAKVNAEAGGGGAKVGTNTVGVSGGRKQSQSESLSVGNQSECTVEKIGQSAGKPPYGCDAPIRVKLVPVRRKLRYHFERRTVVGSHSQQSVVTASELAELAKTLEDALRERGRRHDVEIVPVADPGEADLLCGVGMDVHDSKYYALECRGKGEQVFAQEGGEQATLGNTAWTVANRLFPPLGEVRRDPDVGRLVIMVDVSTSMIVNDEQTFIYPNVRRSVRYGLVDATLGGLLTHDITPEVSLMVFAGNGCVKAANVGGAGFTRLTPESQKLTLKWLEAQLETSPCIDGTDIVSALSEAKALLGSSEPDTGHDAVLLITDGSHRGGTSSMTVQDAARELIDVGADVHVIRVQLNDIQKFRALMEDGRKRKDILARWSKFSRESGWEATRGDPPEKGWAIEIAGVSEENKGGADLLANLTAVGVSTLVLNDDDLLRDPLVTVGRFVLPKLGARPTFDTVDCTPPRSAVFPDDGVEYWQRSCRIHHVPVGREIIIKTTVPRCMQKLVRASFSVPGWDRDLVVTNAENLAGDAILTFESVRLGRSEPGLVNTGVTGELLLKSEIETGERCR